MADSWTSKWTASYDGLTEDEQIILEAKENYKYAEAWEATYRIRFNDDLKFANGDTYNKYQWDSDIVTSRELEDRPCLTVNKTQQHNLQIINDGRQNKPGIRIRPTGGRASFEGAQVYQQLIYHIDYISNAENVYDYAMGFQVNAGKGYWRVKVDRVHPKTFDQEIYISKVKNPLSVYLDPDINEDDGSDARWGIIFENLDKKLAEKEHPEIKGLLGSSTLGNRNDLGEWLGKDKVIRAEYYRKTEKKEKLVAFIDPSASEQGEQVVEFLSKLTPEQKKTFDEIKEREKSLEVEFRNYKEAEVITNDIQWFKIVGDRIVDRGPWLGEYVPIVRLPGIETIIDGQYDCKGHTRCLIDPQRIYNYNTSANVEYGALQSKSPWVTSVEAIRNFEEYYRLANIKNFSYMPYNAFDEDGNPLPAPTRNVGPQPSPAFIEGLKIASNEMMMASGQYQSQLGENENAKSGVAINSRQRQGDRATYHFVDNQAIAIRFTGKIIIDLIPKVYDTERIVKIEAKDGTIYNIQIDPNAEESAIIEQTTEAEAKRIKNIVFNPNVGTYDLMADTGPSYATRRMEAFSALMDIAAHNEKFMDIAGDILWTVADFPEAQLLADRWRKVIPPNITGDAPNPQMEAAMHAASDKIEQQLAIIAQQAKDLADKQRDFDLKEMEFRLREKEAIAIQHRLDYEAETKRVTSLGNSGPAISVEQIQPVVVQLLQGMLNAKEPGSGDRILQELIDAKPEPQELETADANAS